MTNDPDQIRAEIERTRAGLSSDVDALAYKASPSRIVEERKQRVRTAIRSTREKIMGTVSDTGSTVSDKASGAASTVSDKASDAAHAVSGKASDAADAVRQAPAAVKARTEGNPLAAGLIAFGAGWLISSLLPPSQKERQLAADAKSALQEHGSTLAQEAKNLAGEVGEHLRGPAEEAVGQLRETATDAAQNVREEGRSAAGDVKDQAGRAREEVRSS